MLRNGRVSSLVQPRVSRCTGVIHDCRRGRGMMVDRSSYSDRTLKCRDCSGDFIWTAGEQAFFREKGLQNIPVRCPDCRAARKVEMGVKPPVQHQVICAECGAHTTVPFVPRQGRPVYCGPCFSQTRDTAPADESVEVHADS
jgi:CxxC-x17-CxxC domain-containing protein